MELGCTRIGGQILNLDDDNRYIAEQNDGGVWCAYHIELPVISVGYHYYRVCNCLNIEGKVRKVKGFNINIFDYEVIDNVIKVKDFIVTR